MLWMLGTIEMTSCCSDTKVCSERKCYIMVQKKSNDAHDEDCDRANGNIRECKCIKGCQPGFKD